MGKNVIKEFTKLSMPIFTNALASYGFKNESKMIESNYCKIVFVKGECYININAYNDPREGPPYFNITLGEGLSSFPDSDWNSIALWRLKNHIEGKNDGSEYKLGVIEDTSHLLELSKQELLKYAAGFLANDLESFKNARSEMNRDREPYETTWKDKSGEYITESDPESVKLKEKYS